MLFELSLDTLSTTGKKILTDHGHIASFSSALLSELDKLKINPKFFAEIVLNFLKEGTKQFSSYLQPLPKRQGCRYYARVIDFWLNYGSQMQHLILILANYDDVSEILILDPQLFQNAIDKLLSFAVSKDCLEILMSYPYKFVVFETFNVFKKKFNVKFEGIIGDSEKYLVILDEDMKALLWKVESPKLDFIRNFHSAEFYTGKISRF